MNIIVFDRQNASVTDILNSWTFAHVSVICRRNSASEKIAWTQHPSECPDMELLGIIFTPRYNHKYLINNNPISSISGHSDGCCVPAIFSLAELRLHITEMCAIVHWFSYIYLGRVPIDYEEWSLVSRSILAIQTGQYKPSVSIVSHCFPVVHSKWVRKMIGKEQYVAISILSTLRNIPYHILRAAAASSLIKKKM